MLKFTFRVIIVVDGVHRSKKILQKEEQGANCVGMEHSIPF